MGSIVSLLTSFKIMMGVPLLGSIIKPLILTSISIKTSNSRCGRRRHLPVETVGFGLGHFNFQNPPDRGFIGAEIYNLIAGRVPLQVLLGPRAGAFGQD